MKIKFLASVVAIAGSVAFFSSFEKAENSTGSITVTVMQDDEPSGGALVGVSASEEDRENSEYIHEEEANSHGVIKFSNIAPGTYYLDAANGDYYGEAEVEVADGDVSVTITMVEDEDEE